MNDFPDWIYTDKKDLSRAIVYLVRSGHLSLPQSDISDNSVTVFCKKLFQQAALTVTDSELNNLMKEIETSPVFMDFFNLP